MARLESHRSGDRSLLRRMNSHAALVTLRGGALTVTELREELGLSRTAVEEVVRDLEERGWIREHADASAERKVMGRPAKRYAFAADAGFVAGVDIGANKVLALVTDLSGVVRGSARASVHEDDSVAQRLKAADRALRSAAKKAGTDLAGLWCVGVGSPGSITPDGVVERYGGAGMPGWAGTELGRRLQDRWSRPVTVDGDSNLGLLAEHWVGSAQGARHIVFVLSGNRTGAGIMIGGELYRGARGATGLIGELPELGWAGVPEIVASIGNHGIDPDRAALFAAAGKGDAIALAAVDRIAELLAHGVAALVLTLDPELVVLGGGLSRAGDVLVSPLLDHLDRLHAGPASFAVSTLGDESVALGAVRIALDRIDGALLHRVRHASTIGYPDASLGEYTRE